MFGNGTSAEIPCHFILGQSVRVTYVSIVGQRVPHRQCEAGFNAGFENFRGHDRDPKTRVGAPH